MWVLKKQLNCRFTCSVSMASFGPPQKTIQAKGKGSAGSRGQPKSGGQVRSPSSAKSAPAPRLSDRLNPKTIDPVRCLFLLSNRWKCFHFQVNKFQKIWIWSTALVTKTPRKGPKCLGSTSNPSQRTISFAPCYLLLPEPSVIWEHLEILINVFYSLKFSPINSTLPLWKANDS